MLKYVLQRIALALITAFIIISFTYILVAMLPITQALAGMKDPQKFAYLNNQVNLGYVLDMRMPVSGYKLLWNFVDANGKAHYFYRMPVINQYLSWLGNIITKWDWGLSTSLRPNNSAMSIIMERLPVTLMLNVIAMVLSVPLGIFLGIMAGLNKNTWFDHTTSTLVMVFISVPSFVVISFLLWVFAYSLDWLPTQWPINWLAASTPKKILSLIIPVASLSFGSICGYTRFVRAELCEVMSSEYLLLARTKGLTKNQAIVHHALRNAFVPILPSILAEFIGLLSGSMILENIYGIPGIGRIYITAVNSKDWSVMMVDMAVLTTIGLMANIILDLSYGFIDPRIRMGAKK